MDDLTTKLKTRRTDIDYMLNQVEEKDPKVAIRHMEYVNSILTRILNQHFDFDQMKDFLLGASFERIVLDAAKEHCKVLLYPSEQNWMRTRPGKGRCFFPTALKEFNDFKQAAIHQKIPKDAKDVITNYPERHGWLDFIGALIIGIPDEWMPDKADVRDSTEWPLVPGKPGEPEIFYDLNTFTADVANAVCFHLYGMQPSEEITLEDGTKRKRPPVPYGSLPFNSTYQVAGNTVDLVTSQMIEYELRMKLNNKKKAKRSHKKHGSRKKSKTTPGNVDGFVNVRSILNSSDTLEAMYRISSGMDTPAPGSSSTFSSTGNNSSAATSSNSTDSSDDEDDSAALDDKDDSAAVSDDYDMNKELDRLRKCCQDERVNGTDGHHIFPDNITKQKHATIKADLVKLQDHLNAVFISNKTDTAELTPLNKKIEEVEKMLEAFE